MRNFLLVLTAVLLIATPKAAVATENFPAFNAGGYGVMLTDGEFVGGYLYFGPSWTAPVRGTFSVIPSLYCQFDPGNGNWGCGGGITIDLLVTSWLAVDWSVLANSDTDRTSRTTAYVVTGPALTLVTPKMSVSIGAQLTYGLRGEGLSFSIPAVNLSWPLQ